MVLPIEGEMPKGRGGLIRIMKKTYIIPSIEVVNIEAVEMLAASISIDRTQSGKQQLGNERGEDRQWGNIWAD